MASFWEIFALIEDLPTQHDYVWDIYWHGLRYLLGLSDQRPFEFTPIREQNVRRAAALWRKGL